MNISLSRSGSLIISGWLVIVLAIFMLIFGYLTKLNFNSNFNTTISLLTLYQKRYWLLSAISIYIVLQLFIIYIRIYALPYHFFVRLILSFLPTLFIISTILGIAVFFHLVKTLDIPVDKSIYPAIKYVQKLSPQTISNAINTLPLKNSSIYLLIYGISFCYLGMILTVTILPLQFNAKKNKRYIILNGFPILLFLLTCSIIIYYLIRLAFTLELTP